MRVAFIGNPQSKQAKGLMEALDSKGVQVYVDKFNPEISNMLDSFKKTRDFIVGSDVVVADDTVISPESNFKLALALEYRRPTLLLISNSNPNKESLLDGLRHRNLRKEVYKSVEEAKTIIEDFISEMKDSLDAKLFMNIPPSMNRYLDWVATHTQRSKSDVVRVAVERAAKEDADYQKFLKSLD